MTISSINNHNTDNIIRSVERRRDSSSSKHHSNKETTSLALVPYIACRPPIPLQALFSKEHRSTPLLLLPPSITQHDDNNEPALVSDIIPHILSFMDAITLSRASSTCRSWNTLANSNDLWNELCKDKFGILASELRPPPDPTRVLYVMSYLRMKEAFYGVGASGRREESVPVISGAMFRRLNT